MVLFLRLNLIKIIHQNGPDCTNHFKIFFGEHASEPPSISVADIIISICDIAICYSELYFYFLIGRFIK